MSGKLQDKNGKEMRNMKKFFKMFTPDAYNCRAEGYLDTSVKVITTSVEIYQLL
jgi:hypothetical protein